MPAFATGDLAATTPSLLVGDVDEARRSKFALRKCGAINTDNLLMELCFHRAGPDSSYRVALARVADGASDLASSSLSLYVTDVAPKSGSF